MAKISVIVFTSLFWGAIAMQLMGGWRQGDIKDGDILKTVGTVVNKIEEQSNSPYSYHLVELLDVKTQIVSGVNYNFTFVLGMSGCTRQQQNVPEYELNCKTKKVAQCTALFYEQVWTNTRKLQKFHCNQFQDYNTYLKSKKSDKMTQLNAKKEFHSKKSGKNTKLNALNSVLPLGRMLLNPGLGLQNKIMPILGAERTVPIGDKGTLAAVDYAVEELNKKTNAMYRTMAYDILKVTKQTVAGTKYSITLKVGISTACRNSEQFSHANLDQCPVGKDARTEICEFEIVHHPWLENDYEITKSDCKPPKSQSTGLFEEFKQKYNKQYANDDEEQMRMKVFNQNMEKVKQLQESEQGSAKYGPTFLADLTEEEFRKNYLTPKWDLSENSFLKKAVIPNVKDLPDAFDWRNHSAVSEVKNQASCGSCWAFSTTGNIEGQWAIKKKKLLSLSEQELVDCDKIDQGCEGGLPSNAYEEIIRLGGLETEKKYPYEASDDKCVFNRSKVSVYITGAVNISKKESDMAQWLFKNGPISIGINAMAMQFYFGGVSHPWGFLCDPSSLDHGVLIVGYGTEKGWFSDNPYWIVKNSWGSSWGEKGYYRVYRGDGTCGLNQMPTSATIDH